MISCIGGEISILKIIKPFNEGEKTGENVALVRIGNVEKSERARSSHTLMTFNIAWNKKIVYVV